MLAAALELRPAADQGRLDVHVGLDFGDQGYVDLVNGCRGDSDADTIDLIVDNNADGATFGARGGAGSSAPLACATSR